MDRIKQLKGTFAVKYNFEVAVCHAIIDLSEAGREENPHGEEKCFTRA